MLDLFTIFSKGGIVLWCFQGTSQLFTPSVNALIKSVILQERGGNNSYNHDALTLKYKLDNEFELVFVVAYQKILQLSYVDKFLNAIQMEFRNKYKDDLRKGKISRNFDFSETFHSVLKDVETQDKAESKQVKQMRTFEQSQKSKKTVSSMIENKKEETGKGGKNKKKDIKAANETNSTPVKPVPVAVGTPPRTPTANGEMDEETLMKNREKFLQRGKKSKTPQAKKTFLAPGGEGHRWHPWKYIRKSPEPAKKGKQARVWENGGTSRDTKTLDHSQDKDKAPPLNGHGDGPTKEEIAWVGQMKGGLRDMDPESSSEEEEEEEEEEEDVTPTKSSNKTSGGGGFGFLSGLRNLVGSKALTRKDIEPALAKMKDHLIVKNVAADIADKLCESVATKLEGKVLGTFSSVTSTVKQLLQEACIQVLSSKRRLDILRDAMDAKAQGRTYNIVFCGVNGVGKSTNLAKVAFWLVENGLRVLIAACDTFRAGAVEQLRTHKMKLNALHPPTAHGGVAMIELYEKGYGKDAAGIAMEAINAARDMKFDVVLIDTAGRMQDNEPLMRALAKLVKVNQPDLVLFVGEALVGNEAIDQLTKFNQALADHSQMENPRLIDGILLTKFDTIDDKVGAAISMTYITGQPIVFVGTGQTYTDLKNLNSRAVVNALLKA